MSRRPRVSSEVRSLVRQRAERLCEYCHTQEKWQYVPFTIDHIIPLAKGGRNEPDNLALACFHCNRRKSDRSTGMDPVSGDETELYHPRQDEWAKHFCWSEDRLHVVGLTAVGRATVETLDLNRERVINIRSADLIVGRHPPAGDPIAADE